MGEGRLRDICVLPRKHREGTSTFYPLLCNLASGSLVLIPSHLILMGTNLSLSLIPANPLWCFLMASSYQDKAVTKVTTCANAQSCTRTVQLSPSVNNNVHHSTDVLQEPSRCALGGGLASQLSTMGKLSHRGSWRCPRHRERLHIQISAVWGQHPAFSIGTTY